LAAHIRLCLPLGAYQFRVERLSTPGEFWDFTGHTFTTAPTLAVEALALLYAFPGATNGIYQFDFGTLDVGQWTDGEYAVYAESPTTGPVSAASMIVANGDTSPFGLLGLLAANYDTLGTIGAALQSGGGGGGTFSGVLAADGVDSIVITSKNGVSVNLRQALRYLLARVGNLDESMAGHSRFADPITGDTLIDASRISTGFTSVFTTIP
jgi:hypothetical protein